MDKEGFHKMSLLELFCAVDDFWKEFEPKWRQQHMTPNPRNLHLFSMKVSFLNPLIQNSR
jgi:hypothetical protein